MFYMSQINPKEAFHNTANSVQLPYITSLSLPEDCIFARKKVEGKIDNFNEHRENSFIVTVALNLYKTE